MVAAFACAAVVSLVACSPAEPARTTEPIGQAEDLRLQIAFQGLCDAATLAQAGEVQPAADMFQDRSHEYLHELADRLSMTDRAAAARLLESKERVEAAIADPSTASPPQVSALITALEAELASAAQTLGMSRPVCGGPAP
jgi:hypothetical protein